MTHLLDTDHISILQRPTGAEYPILVANINLQPVGSVVASIVSTSRLSTHNLRIGTMDLRLAAIAKASNLTVFTRNARDFGRSRDSKLKIGRSENAGAFDD